VGGAAQGRGPTGKLRLEQLWIGILLLTASNLSAATLYVSAGSVNPTPPYTNWATAATSIQQAVSSAAAGDTVLVTNGVYGGGLAVTNPLALLSVNGPEFTAINGGGTNQCASLTNGASLTGFTLTNGYGYANGVGGGVWCASTNAFLTNCVIVGNSAGNGGGAYSGTLYNCTLSGNSAKGIPFGIGGGAARGTLYNCTLSGNSATDYGGGVLGCTLYNCTLTGNSANGPNGAGGGANSCTLYNSALICNSATSGGGGAIGGTLYNCTLTGNAAGVGGGAVMSTFYNCIAYFNTATNGANYYQGTLNYCCTTPIPTNGVGNIALDPQLASASHLSANSPCRGAGSAAYATGTDIDGELWGNPPSMGCDEYHAGAVSGPLTVSLLANYTNVAAGYPVSLTAVIEGQTTESVWEFEDGDVAINQPYATHVWTEGGDYLVALWAFNDSFPGGVSATVTIHVVANPVYYVAAASTNPQPPYASWTTAATNIQDAIDAAAQGDKVWVVVTNGVYGCGGRDGNRIVLDKPLMLLSVNGPQFTAINGGGTNRCASLTNGASLSGFTLVNGYTNGGDGGGVWGASASAFLTNCTLTGNSAASGTGGGASGVALYNCTLCTNSAAYGGGATQCPLYNCSLGGNSAQYGGGAFGGTFYNCTLTGNSASYYGGGAYVSTLSNSTLTGNSATYYGGGVYGGTLYNCALNSNSAGYYGGGAYNGDLYNCKLGGNSSADGGGAAYNTLYNCTLSNNLAGLSGGAAYSSTLYNCTLSTNSAANYGGGAIFGTLYNCTLTGNSAYSAGGGACTSTLCNCIAYFNTAYDGANCNIYWGGSVNYCCTTPDPGGVGNITNAPLFIDYANGNLRLQTNSPCINAGDNAYVTTSTDLDGNTRIVSGTVDIGAYEYQGTGSVISYAWLQQYGFPTDGSADSADPDHDGMNNWQEWVCGTNPTNALSVLRLLSAAPAGTNATVTWQSVAAVNYRLERSTNMGSPFALVSTNVIGQAGTTTYTDTNAIGAGPYFYRVGVQYQ
jgi:parallel beta-helix repeat protein